MPKLVTAKRQDNETELAREYVRAHILFPSAVLGLVFMLSGAGSLIYQFFVQSYGWMTFSETSGLMLLGIGLGWVQTRYHRYLLATHPQYFAARQRLFGRSTGGKRMKKDAQQMDAVEHPGRKWIPLGYLAGLALMVGVAGMAAAFGHVYFMAAFLLPWASFFWAKMFFWRGVLPQRDAAS